MSLHAIAVRLGRSDMGVDKRARAMNVSSEHPAPQASKHQLANTRSYPGHGCHERVALGIVASVPEDHTTPAADVVIGATVCSGEK